MEGYNRALDNNEVDREITNVSIKKAQVVGDDSGAVVLYQVDLKNDFREWTVLKRYKLFSQLDEDLHRVLGKTELADRLPKLPPKRFRLFVDHLDKAFIDERRLSLEEYCNDLLSIPEVANHDVVLQFFLSK